MNPSPSSLHASVSRRRCRRPSLGWSRPWRIQLSHRVPIWLLCAQMGLFHLFGPCPLLQAEPANSFEVGAALFVRHIQPLLQSRCFACHGQDPKDLKGGFHLESRETLMKGGDQFGNQVLLPGNASESALYRLVSRQEKDMEMPPKASEQLTKEELAWVREWIDAGAPWPEASVISSLKEGSKGQVKVPTSGGLHPSWDERLYPKEKLWAWMPLKTSSPPMDHHPVDWFIDQRLKEEGIQPAPPARPEDMIRRLHFNLTGLPPTPEQQHNWRPLFEKDLPEATHKLANWLMDQPAYGEHFARKWLDVTRYADSAGFANDYARPHAWRYRDYVIRSFQQDKPYATFIMEQLAGDEWKPHDAEALLATGFLRMGPWEHTAMSVFKITRQQWLDDITDTVGQVFLGQPLQCAKCHDHKFDPIPTRDYYRIMAIFSTTQMVDRDLPFLEAENQQFFTEAHRWTQEKIEAYQQQKEALSQWVAKGRKADDAAARTGDNGLKPGDEASLARLNKNIARHTLELDKTRPMAMGVYTGSTLPRNNIPGKHPMPEDPWSAQPPEPDTILLSGDVYQTGDLVEPGALSALDSMGDMPESSFPTGQGPRRLALARWISHERNPLMARVIVNRVWSWHFGKGLSEHPNQLGVSSKPPSHPALLDYLADWFVKEGGSIKALHRLILTSQTYQRSVHHPAAEKLKAIDPDNQWYGRFEPRGLSAEELRDAMLTISGELNPSTGGIPSRPEMHEEVATQPRQIMGGAASVYEPDPLPEQRHRRSLYQERLRGLRDPWMETFQQPHLDKSCDRRESVMTSPQALTLFHGIFVRARALAMANRLTKQSLSDSETIAMAFEHTLARPPTPVERDQCLKHWQAVLQEPDHAILDLPHHQPTLTRTVMAEKTGQPYTFEEAMPAYRNFLPDLLPHEVDRRTRALAEVCLVLFNLNEFAYVH